MTSYAPDTRAQLWTLRSADRTSGTATDAVTRLDAPLRLASGGWFRVTAVSVPISYHAVSAANNLVRVTGPWAADVRIPPGSYTAPELATALQTALQASASAGFAVSYSEAGLAFTISHSADPFSFDWSPPDAAAAVLGWPADATPAAATVQLAPGAPSLGEPLAFYVCSSKLSSAGPQGLISGSRGSQVVQRVPNAGARGDLLSWQAVRQGVAEMPFRAPSGGLQLGQVDLQLCVLDQNAALVPLDLRGRDWELELEVSGLE